MSHPSVPTIKRLFAVSGNECAFPGCATPLVDSPSGKVTGRICHIKARKPGAARYDASQSDDERNAFENLLLMCPIHHDVIDSDVESYTVERLQTIKAQHETANTGGPEATDDIAVQLLASIDSDVAIVLTADANGDVLRDSTKVVLGPLTSLDSQEATRQRTAQDLIRDIQSELYEDDRRLPYVLALCLELCERTGLSEKYERWLNRELKGYKDYSGFRDELGSADEFEDWMDEWASHRLVSAHIKAGMQSGQTMQVEIRELPVGSILLGFPVAHIARDLEGARDSGVPEFSVQLLQLGGDHFARLQSIVDELFPGEVVPSDVRLYYRVSQLDQVLDGVRNIVLSLLKDARSRLA